MALLSCSVVVCLRAGGGRGRPLCARALIIRPLASASTDRLYSPVHVSLSLSLSLSLSSQLVSGISSERAKYLIVEVLLSRGGLRRKFPKKGRGAGRQAPTLRHARATAK